MGSLVNFRDVCASINGILGTTVLVCGLLYRSARPDYSDVDELRRLKSGYSINAILDLRTDTERSELPAPTSAVHSLGLRLHVVNFNGRAYTTTLMRQLRYWQMAQLISYYALGYRKEAISVLGQHVLAKRGLVGLAEDSLSCSTAEVKAVFDILAEEAGLPIMIHCTQGKDRTGLVVLLILILLEIPINAIHEDYMLSQKELQPERPQRLAEIRSIGLPDSFADCEPTWVSSVAEKIEQKHGGIANYLQQCGVDHEKQEAIRLRLRA